MTSIMRTFHKSLCCVLRILFQWLKVPCWWAMY